MNADIFAEWFRRQGYRVVRTASSYWYEAGPRIYQAFPYHWTIRPREEELAALLRRQAAIALRYSTPLDAPSGKASYHVVRSGPYGLESLPRQARQNITKGLAYVHVEPIALSRLAQEGWRLRLDTLQRQGRVGAESQQWWRRLCESAADLPGFEAWGALHEGELVAAMFTFTCGDCFTVPHEQSASAHLGQRVNNAIFFRVTEQALQRPGIAQVFLCLQSLDAPCSVDEFKFRNGYLPLPVRQRVVFHPWLAPLVNATTHGLVKKLLARQPQRPALAKAEGMIRFYLDGRKPLAEQEWPECLADCRAEILASR